MSKSRGHNGRGSNLFKIDFDVIERVLADANSDLLKKVDYILRQAEDLPNEVQSKSDAEKFRQLIQDFRSLTKDISQARLADGRPFTEAAKVVKKWFLDTENSLKEKEALLSRQLADYVVLKQSDEHSVEDKPSYTDTLIGTSVDGDPVVTVLEAKIESEPDEARLNIDLEWEVKSFDRSQIPIEQLRNYFSDHSIKQALKKHLDKNGPHQIEGVEYVLCLGKKIQGAKTDRKKRSTPGHVEAKIVENSIAFPGAPWSIEEEKLLYETFKNNAPISDIAIKHGRTRGAIRSHLVHMGLIDEHGNPTDTDFRPMAKAKTIAEAVGKKIKKNRLSSNEQDTANSVKDHDEGFSISETQAINTHAKCQECEAEIHPERLKAMPGTTLCTDCASRSDGHFEKRKVEETWGSREDWQRDRSSWKRSH